MGSLSLSVGRKQSATSTGGMCETILKKSSKKRTWHHPSPLLAYAHMFRRIYRRQGEREESNRQSVRSNQLRALDGESGRTFESSKLRSLAAQGIAGLGINLTSNLTAKADSTLQFRCRRCVESIIPTRTLDPAPTPLDLSFWL